MRLFALTREPLVHSLDVANATSTNSAWKDPDFDPSPRAYYLAE
jgi:hypothetical protein